MLTYATPTDLEQWTGEPAPANADRLLRAASRLVRRETRAAIYDTLPSGAPADPDIADAFRDATCAQAAAWAANSIDPTVPVVVTKPAPKSVKLGSGAVDYGDTASVDQARADLAGSLTLEAAQILADVTALYGAQPRTW